MLKEFLSAAPRVLDDEQLGCPGYSSREVCEGILVQKGTYSSIIRTQLELTLLTEQWHAPPKSTGAPGVARMLCPARVALERTCAFQASNTDSYFPSSRTSVGCMEPLVPD